MAAGRSAARAQRPEAWSARDRARRASQALAENATTSAALRSGYARSDSNPAASAPLPKSRRQRRASPSPASRAAAPGSAASGGEADEVPRMPGRDVAQKS